MLVGDRPKVIAVPLGREDDENLLRRVVLADELDWRLKVSVCGDDHSGIEIVRVGVAKQLRSQADISHLLLVLGPRRVAIVALPGLLLVATVADCQASPSFEGLKVGRLAVDLPGVCPHPGGGVLDGDQLLARFEKPAGQGWKIKPQVPAPPLSQSPK